MAVRRHVEGGFVEQYTTGKGNSQSVHKTHFLQLSQLNINILHPKSVQCLLLRLHLVLMPGPLYAQSVLDLVHKLLFPLYTQIFLHYL